MNPYCRLIPRLNGTEIEERFEYYHGLVKKGVAGFIVFGGEIETVRERLRELQQSSDKPLIIASDLEQGLGQQIKGGTIFPPAMAIASAIKKAGVQEASSLLERLYTAIALEAGYAGMNTIHAPVLDINTNPENPIIATRAFGEDPETVSYLGCEMIKILQQNSIMACGKHFPGHGDTETDSHISLPVIKKDLRHLENNELIPFKKAINAGISMIMLGHLSVPAIEPSGLPASLSNRAVSYLKDKLGFKGILITDAMNMGGIGGYKEEAASLMALRAGVDLVLHPTDSDSVASYLRQKDHRQQPLAIDIAKLQSDIPFDICEHRKLSERLAEMAVKTDGIFEIEKPFVIILDDDSNKRGLPFINALTQRYPNTRHCIILPGDKIPWHIIPADSDLIVCIFSEVKAWKGRTGQWLYKNIDSLRDKARVFISLGNPYPIKTAGGEIAKIYAFCDSEISQEAVARILINSGKGFID